MTVIAGEAPAPKPALKVYEHAPSSVAFKKLRKRILRQTQEVVSTFGLDQLREDGTPQKWLVCLSGGKDSYGLLAALLDLQWQGGLKAELLVCNLDQMQPGFPKHVLPDYLTALGVPHKIITEDTYSIVTDKVPEGKTYCSMCSRLRRGILYRVAREEGCDAIVLGHHRDDALETFMMNLMHGGRLAAMPPALMNDEGDVKVLRPLIFTAERDLAKFSELCQFPIIPCTLCGSQDGLQRMLMKDLLDRWEEKRPGQRDVMFRALRNVRQSHLVDEKVFDFERL
ncbi:tRNA 2-thiocytidine(32) synthetase TtcA [Parvularcula sp. ZS-1/3]|uniref:tRNA-cytidine(32) 2-sulfurtransferase n=2 Tax=Parvularcula mediterranea TaxID=2732508 RepID=A0A7Y3RKZ9_9PROT|nr:tRNA 2-thiocytidine(32) synthetase TtcA [Parvularcula mediterranea]